MTNKDPRSHIRFPNKKELMDTPQTGSKYCKSLAILLWMFTALVASSPAQTILFGDNAIEAQRDSNALGTAEAFQTTATASGTLTSLVFYVDGSSTVTQITLGLYADKSGIPGALLTQGKITTITLGAFNTVSVPATAITSGTPYWIAVLGTGSGKIMFRDRNRGPCKSVSNSVTGLTALPANWSPGTTFTDCPLSGYGTGSTTGTPILSLSPNTLSFSAVQGGANPNPTSFGLSNTGSGTLSYNISSDSAWLTASPSSGTAPQTVQVSANITGLAANTYTGHLTVTATGAQGSPGTVTVTLTVSPPPNQPVLSVSPQTASFNAVQGGSNPSSVPVSVTNTGTGTLSFTTSSDATWLGVSPGSGNAPATLQLTASIGTMTAGTYTGHVTVTATGITGSPATVTATLTISPPASPSAVGDWLMVDHDPGRSGFAPDEAAISTATAANMKLRWSLNVDGQVSSQPLYAGSINFGTTVRDLLVIATSGNSIYGLDANSGDVLWHRNFGSQGTNCTLPGGFGVFGAPLVDRTALRIYAVSDDGSLRTISLLDGTDAAPALSLVANPTTNKVWGGMNRMGNNLYFATASDGCDTKPWRAQIYRVDLSGAAPALVNSFVVVPGIADPNGGGGIWGYGGVSIDTNTGNVFAATGDDSNEGFTPWADRMLALDSGLNLLGNFEATNPSNFPCGSAPCDLDFGSTPIVFQPNGCSLMTAAGSKNGILYLLKASDLIASGTPLQMLTLSTPNDSLGSGGVGGVPAFWPEGNMLFVADRGGVTGISGGLVGLTVTNACTLNVAWSVALGGSDLPNSTPTIANGVVFVGVGEGGEVHGYNALTGVELWNSGVQNGANTFGAPMIARGKLYFGSWNGFGATDGGSVYSFAPNPFPGPVLGGDQTVEANVDFNPTGVAEAFPITATASGKVSALTIFLDSSSTATQMFAGLYADAGGHPGALLTQADLNAPSPGNWVTITLPTTDIVAGTPYWIAILGTGTGTLKFRDLTGGPCLAESNAQTGLTQLPVAWTTGSTAGTCPISGYVIAVAPSQPILSVTPTTLALSAPQGQTAQSSISVANSGGGSAALNFSAVTDSPWLTVLPTGGNAPQTVQVTADSTGLAQNTFTGHITVTSAGVQGSPATVTVNFTVAPPPPPNPVLNVSPGTLSFAGTQGGSNPPVQTVSVTNVGSGTLSFTAASDSSWLSASPGSANAPQTLQVSVNLANLTANTYTGHLTVTGATGVGNSPATVTVTLVVAAPPPPSLLLFGDTATETQRDKNALGSAEAFQTTAVASGPLGTMFVFLDPTSTVSTIWVGLYTDNAGHPGTLLSQASSSTLTAGAWNTITVPTANITNGTSYWIALLGTGSGSLFFRDRSRGPCVSEGSAQTNLTTLPQTWSSGQRFTDCPISAYGKTSP